MRFGAALSPALANGATPFWACKSLPRLIRYFNAGLYSMCLQYTSCTHHSGRWSHYPASSQCTVGFRAFFEPQNSSGTLCAVHHSRHSACYGSFLPVMLLEFINRDIVSCVLTIVNCLSCDHLSSKLDQQEEDYLARSLLFYDRLRWRK